MFCSSPIAYQVGMLAFGPLDPPVGHAQGIAISGSLVIISILATLALATHPPIWVPVGAIIVIGFFSASGTMVITHGRGIFPDRLIGRGMATINTAVMLGVACMQTLSGIIVGAFEPLADGARTETAYRALFGVLTVVLIVAVAIYSRSAGRQAQRRNAHPISTAQCLSLHLRMPSPPVAPSLDTPKDRMLVGIERNRLAMVLQIALQSLEIGKRALGWDKASSISRLVPSSMNQKRAGRRPIFEPAMFRTVDLDQLADMLTSKRCS
jgi:MFS family permease